LRIARLQKVVAEAVTDPTEQAELDEQRNCRSNVVHTLGTVRSSEQETPSPLVELCQQLPAEDRPSLLTRMAAELPPEEQLDLLEQVASGLPVDVARKLEEELRVARQVRDT